MSGFTVKSFDTLVSDMAAWVTAHSPQISDMTPGSVIRSICEGAALCLEELYVGTYLGFKRQLHTVQQDIYNFARKLGTKSTTSVVFSRAGTVTTVTIPIGTRISTATDVRFVTTAVGSITPGNTTSSSVPVEAYAVGVAYNVSAAAINTMVDNVDEVTGVTNAVAATGGTNEESEYEYQKRFQLYIEGLGRCNLAGLRAGALSVDGITSASTQELFPPVANVNVNLWVDDSSVSGVGAAKLAEVQAVIDGDGTEANPGYRAAGINVVVKAPSVVTQAVTAAITLLPDSSIDQTQVGLDINTILASYVNNLGIGEDIIRNELISAIMSVYGVTDLTMSAPAANVSVSTSQVGRLGTVTLTYV